MAKHLTVGNGHRDALFDQLINLAVRRLQTHRRAAAGQRVERVADRLRWQGRVELDPSAARKL